MSKTLKFSGSNCAPCKAMNVQMINLADKLGNVTIEEVTIENNMDLVRKYGVRSVPTLIKVDGDGSELHRSVGTLSDEKLLEFLL